MNPAASNYSVPNRVLQLDPRDNVLIALADLRKGEQIPFESQTYTLESDVAAKHKFATEDLAVGASVRMYGVIVGKAVKPIPRGEASYGRQYPPRGRGIPREDRTTFAGLHRRVSRWMERTFLGYRRKDGQSRHAKLLGFVVLLVFCENRNIGVLKQAFEEELGFAAPRGYRSQVVELGAPLSRWPRGRNQHSRGSRRHRK